MRMLNINGKDCEVDVPEDMPLLWVLRDVLGLTGTKFGCGIAQCGVCTVHVDGQPIRSCIMSVGAVTGKKIMTIEAIGQTPTGAKVQKAWLDLEVVQCGYCQALSGTAGSKHIMAAHAFDVAPVSFPKGITDIDTPEDYRKLQLAVLPQDLQGT